MTTTINDSQEKIYFQSVLKKLTLQEQEPTLDNIMNKSNQLESELNLKYSEKYSECVKIFEKIKTLTKDSDIITNTLNNSRIVIKSTPKKGKSKEFNENLKSYNSCIDKFIKLDTDHQLRISNMYNFSNFAYNKCIDENCEKNYIKNNKEQGSNEKYVKNCIRDCFKYDKINKTILANLMNEELKKFISGVDKI